MSKYLVVTSDDFGVCHSVNRGIVEGFRNGVLQSTNFMATTPWFPEAVRLAKEYDIPVGVHLTLTCEWTGLKHSPITKAPSLVDHLGYFYTSYEELFSYMDIGEVKNEYRAQINRVINAGIVPTHVETHMMPPLIYNYPEGYHKVHRAVVEVANEFNLIYTYDTENRKQKYFDEFLELTKKSYSEITDQLSSLGNGVYHLICHCGCETEEMNSLSLPSEGVYSWGGRCRQQDLDIISSRRFRDFLDRNDFKLIGIKELLEVI